MEPEAGQEPLVKPMLFYERCKYVAGIYLPTLKIYVARTNIFIIAQNVSTYLLYLN